MMIRLMTILPCRYRSIPNGESFRVPANHVDPSRTVERRPSDDQVCKVSIALAMIYVKREAKSATNVACFTNVIGKGLQ